MSFHSFQFRDEDREGTGYFFAYADAELVVGACVDVCEGGRAVYCYSEGSGVGFVRVRFRGICYGWKGHGEMIVPRFGFYGTFFEGF